ncbi:MAG: nuclear transport factor 2 family protein [Actinobacteria bacterium]|nr:nuclear transport factor 2 family protein [Actinomycetota bacterium]MCL5445457.1 nuclear transport factor 2 family protein [Actinomycetota bacterium]
MRLEDIEAIQRLKYSYFRLLDLKRFSELGELLSEDCTASYGDGSAELVGRTAIVKFLDESLSNKAVVSMHHGHHPEITFNSDTTADGVWYLQYRVIVPGFDLEVSGSAYYRDSYEKVDGNWVITHTGYDRVFEERRKHSSHAITSFSSRFEPGAS